jgi:hypothetical protein
MSVGVQSDLVRTVLTRVVACVAVFSLVGCASLMKQPPRADLSPWPEIKTDLPVETLRTRLNEYSVTFAAQVDLAAASIERQATDAGIRRNAVLWRVRAIPEMRKACFRLEPIAGLVDAWIFARQMDQLFSVGAAADAFGTLQPDAVAVSRRLLAEVREIAASVAVSPEAQLEFERKFIDPWLVDHPLHDITFVRDSPIGRFAEQTPKGGDAFQSVGTMEDVVVTLSQQARIYLADLPRQMRGEVDLMRSDILPPDSVASMQGDLRLSAAAADRIAGSVENALPLVLSERRIILDEMNRQRALVMAAVTLEREQAIGAIIRTIAAERSDVLRSVESQRLATLQWATGERREAIGELRGDVTGSMDALRRERALLVDDLRTLVDSVLLRLAMFLVAAVVVAPLVAHAYARVWPRRWHEPHDDLHSNTHAQRPGTA